MQYSAFDFRLLQSPDLLVSPIRSWPHVQPNQEFINNFGLIRESYESVLSPYLLPEDNVYVDCRRSLKFRSLTSQDDPLAIHVKLRRMTFDGKGGVKLLIGMIVDFGEGISFEELEDVLDYVLKKKIRISAPDQQPKEIALSNLSAAFKNLYAHSSSLFKTDKADKHLVRSQNPLLLLDMSQREFEHFKPEGKYTSFFFPEELQLLFNRNELGGKPINTFLTLNVNSSALNRLAKYHLSQLNAYVENVQAMLAYYKRGEEFSEKAKQIFEQAHRIVSGESLPDHLLPIHKMYASLFQQQLARIQQENIAELLSEGKSSPDKIFQKLIESVVEGRMDKTFALAEEFSEIFEPEDKKALLILETRHNRVLREEIDGTENPEDLRIERNRISSALLKLFRYV